MLNKAQIVGVDSQQLVYIHWYFRLYGYVTFSIVLALSSVVVLDVLGVEINEPALIIAIAAGGLALTLSALAVLKNITTSTEHADTTPSKTVTPYWSWLGYFTDLYAAASGTPIKRSEGVAKYSVGSFLEWGSVAKPWYITLIFVVVHALVASFITAYALIVYLFSVTFHELFDFFLSVPSWVILVMALSLIVINIGYIVFQFLPQTPVVKRVTTEN